MIPTRLIIFLHRRFGASFRKAFLNAFSNFYHLRSPILLHYAPCKHLCIFLYKKSNYLCVFLSWLCELKNTPFLVDRMVCRITWTPPYICFSEQFKNGMFNDTSAIEDKYVIQVFHWGNFIDRPHLLTTYIQHWALFYAIFVFLEKWA